MIPKVIHYCWFGPNPLPEKDKAYMETWRKFMPDYEIKLWNEDNFDINLCPYVQQAYANKKFAFVSDVARLYALVNEGGIYLDTDVELLRGFSHILDNQPAVIGFESDRCIQTAFMASAPGNPIFSEWLESYTKMRFLKDNGRSDLTTNAERLTNILRECGLRIDGSFQRLPYMTVLPAEYVCPFNNITHRITITENTFCYHHFAGTWLEGKYKLRHCMHRTFGPKLMQILTATKRFILRRKA